MSLFACFLILSTVTGQTVSLENASLRAEWDARGAMVSLCDKAAGREWLEPGEAQGYRLHLTDATELVTLSGAESVSVRKEAGEVVIEARHAKPLGLTVTCRFRLEDDSPNLLGRIAVAAAAPCRIAEAWFPLVALRAPFSGSGEEDQVLLPYCDGCVARNPLKTRLERECSYPGAASMQMIAAFDPAAGLLLASRDNQAHTKTFWVSGRKKKLEMGINHRLEQTPRQQWQLGYDVVLAGLGAGPITWETAADRYAEWARRQPWCRQTTAQRVAAGDIPKWIVEPSLLFTFSLRGKTASDEVGNRLPLVVEQVDAWRRMAGAPITYLVISWEKHDTWVTPDYFPPYGGTEAFTAMTRALHARGDRTMVFLSGLNWTLRKELPKSDRPPVLIDDQPAFNQRGRRWAISDADGQALLIGKHDAGVGEHAIICPATPLAREILLGSSLECQSLGIDCVQADQIVGGGTKACFHPQHGHAPGGGNWCSEALRRIYAEIRKGGKRRNPDFAFSMEEPGEFYIPVLDIYHARDAHQGRWPRSGAGVLGVPLFTHVYHDYLPGYGSEGCYVSPSPSRTTMYQLAMNLVCAKTPAVALWGRWLEPDKVDPAQQRLLRAHLDLWRGPAGEFLVYGRRVTAPPLDVPSIDMTFTEKDGKTRRPLAIPSVLDSLWRLPDGRQAALYVSIANAPVTFTAAGERLTLQPGQAECRISKPKSGTRISP